MSTTTDPKRMLDMLRTDPGTVLFGAGLIEIVASPFARFKIGPLSGDSSVSLILRLAIGAILVIVGILVIRRQRQTISSQWSSNFPGDVPAEVLDREFLLKVFLDAMPPAFVKEWKPSGPRRHLLETEALVKVQDREDPMSEPTTGSRNELIANDHCSGDDLAKANKVSLQLEQARTNPAFPERTILTTKTRIDHRGHTYIVGWFVPIKFGPPERASLDSQLNADGHLDLYLEESNHQVMYDLDKTKFGEGVEVRVANAVRQPPATPASHH